MSTFTHKTGLSILEIIARQNTNYGKNTLAKIVWHTMGGFSISQAKDLLSQLIEKGYLQEMNVGIRFAMIVIVLTTKGREAINYKEEITLDFHRFYSDTFKQASDIGIVDKDLLEEYYNIKKELQELTTREEELKETIKVAMTERQADVIQNEYMDIFLKKAQRVTYPKEKIERLCPPNLLEQIRTTNTITILSVKLKEQKKTTL